jgi:hypothetical protein
LAFDAQASWTSPDRKQQDPLKDANENFFVKTTPQRCEGPKLNLSIFCIIEFEQNGLYTWLQHWEHSFTEFLSFKQFARRKPLQFFFPFENTKKNVVKPRKSFFEMNVSIHSLFTPDELARELKWLEARDTLLGENYAKQDVKRALELAASSEHPQCQWLTGLFAGKTVTTVKEVCDVFLADEKKSPASLSATYSQLQKSQPEIQPNTHKERKTL